MKVENSFLAKRVGAGLIDGAIELWGGILGSYFGAMVAALTTALRNGPAEEMQSSMWSGFGFGFVFWTLAISFLNRVLIQGVSRASIGKKVFKLEIISTRDPLTWTTMTKRWVFSFVSFAGAGAGYWYMFFNPENRSLHDVLVHTDIVPHFEGKSMTVEYREESVAMVEIRKMMILSNNHAERPMATVISLPVRVPEPATAQIKATGTDGSATLAEVIELKKDEKKAA